MTDIKKIIKLLEIKDTFIIGSYADKKLKYFNDIDLHDIDDDADLPENILNEFKEIYDEAYKTPGVYVIEFKMGSLSPPEYQNIKWSPSEIYKGYKMINGVKYNFTYLIKKKAVIKIEVIAFVKDHYIEFSNNYFFKFPDGTDTTVHEDAKTELLRAFETYKKKNNYYKAYKRLYGYFKLSEQKDAMNQILKMLNSPLGLMDQNIYALEIVSTVINQTFKKPPKGEIITSLKYIRDNINNDYRDYIISILKLENKSLRAIDNKIHKVISELRNINNSLVKSYTKKFNLTKYIYNL